MNVSFCSDVDHMTIRLVSCMNGSFGSDMDHMTIRLALVSKKAFAVNPHDHMIGILYEC